MRSFFVVMCALAFAILVFGGLGSAIFESLKGLGVGVVVVSLFGLILPAMILCLTPLTIAIVGAIWLFDRLVVWAIPFELPAFGFGWSQDRGWFTFSHGFRWKRGVSK